VRGLPAFLAAVQKALVELQIQKGMMKSATSSGHRVFLKTFPASHRQPTGMQHPHGDRCGGQRE